MKIYACLIKFLLFLVTSGAIDGENKMTLSIIMSMTSSNIIICLSLLITSLVEEYSSDKYRYCAVTASNK